MYTNLALVHNFHNFFDITLAPSLTMLQTCGSQAMLKNSAKSIQRIFHAHNKHPDKPG